MRKALCFALYCDPWHMRVMEITPKQSRAARALLGWDLARAAAASEVNQRSISNFEGERTGLSRHTMRALVSAYQAAGIVFTEHGLELKPGG
jgi:hypothetical protein